MVNIVFCNDSQVLSWGLTSSGSASCLLTYGGRRCSSWGTLRVLWTGYETVWLSDSGNCWWRTRALWHTSRWPSNCTLLASFNLVLVVCILILNVLQIKRVYTVVIHVQYYKICCVGYQGFLSTGTRRTVLDIFRSCSFVPQVSTHTHHQSWY